MKTTKGNVFAMVIIAVVFGVSGLFGGKLLQKPTEQPKVWTVSGPDSFLVDDIDNGYILSGSNLIADAAVAREPYKFQIIPQGEEVCLMSSANPSYITDEPFMMVLIPGSPSSSFRVISYSAWLKLGEYEWGYHQCWSR